MLEDIRRNALEARRHVGDYMDMLLAIKEDRQKEEIERCRRELKKADRRMEELTKILNKLYEDVALEKISFHRMAHVDSCGLRSKNLSPYISAFPWYKSCLYNFGLN